MERRNLLSGSFCYLTSKHSKLRAVGKPIRRLTGLRVFEDDSFDTDLLGTFSGEIERTGSVSEVVLRKARMASSLRSCRFGLATEGSFGPHPQLPFVPIHTEIIGFVDLETNVSILESILTQRTNFSVRDFGPSEDLEPFLKQVGFPSHALIARPNVPSGGRLEGIEKGIRDLASLESAISIASRLSGDGRARVETDMRAHLNPTRQLAIRALSRKIASRLATLCPECGYPGWGGVSQEPGLECEECGLPTRWVKSVVHGCARCGERRKLPRPDGKVAAPAGSCEICNP